MSLLIGWHLWHTLTKREKIYLKVFGTPSPCLEETCHSSHKRLQNRFTVPQTCLNSCSTSQKAFQWRVDLTSQTRTQKLCQISWLKVDHAWLIPRGPSGFTVGCSYRHRGENRGAASGTGSQQRSYWPQYGPITSEITGESMCRICVSVQWTQDE